MCLDIDNYNRLLVHVRSRKILRCWENIMGITVCNFEYARSYQVLQANLLEYQVIFFCYTIICNIWTAEWGKAIELTLSKPAVSLAHFFLPPFFKIMPSLVVPSMSLIPAWQNSDGTCNCLKHVHNLIGSFSFVSIVSALTFICSFPIFSWSSIGLTL